MTLFLAYLLEHLRNPQLVPNGREASSHISWHVSIVKIKMWVYSIFDKYLTFNHQARSPSEGIYAIM
jgi:hypothetical protein